MATKKEVFISYHTSSSKAVVEKICSALEGAGISCWYAPRDVEGPYALSIVKAVKECKVFLLILNQESSGSEHVLNEINCAFERFCKHEDIVMLPFRIDECELGDAIWYYLGRIHIMDGSIPPEITRIRELIDRISTILGKEQVREASVVHDKEGTTKQYRLVGRRDYPDNQFVGRRKEIQCIHRQLTSSQNKLFLVGMGGIGKSEIAKMYCDIYRDDYDVVLWVSFQESLQATVINDFAFPIQGLSRSDYAEDDDEQYFQRKVSILKEIADARVLIVIDNFDVKEDRSLRTFCDGEYSVLFTTRYHSLSKQIPELEIPEVTDPQEQMEIFRSEYVRVLDEDNLDTVNSILQLLGGHPLSIRLVASAMKSGRISPEKMHGLLTQGSLEMKNRNAKAAELIFGRLKQVFSLAALNEEEQYLLKNLALLPLAGVSVESLYDWCQMEDFDVIDGLIEKSWVIHNVATDEVHLHPLVCELMREELEQDMHACDPLVDFLVDELPKLDKKKYNYKKQFMECYASVSQALPKEHPQWWDLRFGAGHMLYMQSRFDSGFELLKQLLAETTDVELQLKLYNKLAKGNSDCGRCQEVVKMAREGLRLVEGIPEETLPGKAGAHKRNLHIRLGEAYRMLKQYDEAERYMRMTLANCHIYYDNTPEEERAWTQLFLACILMLKSDPNSWEESEQLFAEAYQFFEQKKLMHGCGYVYRQWSQLRIPQKQYQKGLEDAKKAREILLQYTGERHLNVALIGLNEANIYRAMGEEDMAILCYEKAKAMLWELGHRRMAESVTEIINSKEVGYIN